MENITNERLVDWLANRSFNFGRMWDELNDTDKTAGEALEKEIKAEIVRRMNNA